MDYELKRSISDIQSKIASLDFSVMAASRRAASPSPRDLITRVATCYLLGRQKPMPRRRSRPNVTATTRPR